MTDCCETFTIVSNCYTITLDKPVWGGEDNKINKNLANFQFWTDTYKVHDRGIASQPLILNGIDTICGERILCFPLCFPICFDKAWFAKFMHLHEIMDNHEEVIITGLGDCMDAVYIIKDFKVDTVPRHGKHYLAWALTLEKRRD